ncbi:biogenesis of lysosome-related organelles complex 1 subunit 2-like [Notamacropus eugenii]|uniref:biogenesis of lysosome-related organelles complex 1 subunit 2-like n=1 Tax=Notamacropus eugenii TaxID=9315 RepID=UPI003B681024
MSFLEHDGEVNQRSSKVMQPEASMPGTGRVAIDAAMSLPNFEETVHSEDQCLDDTVVKLAEEAEADITRLCKDLFSKMAMYLTEFLAAISENYTFLGNMNKLTSLKYLEMKTIAVNIVRNLKDLNQKYAAFKPYLDQIPLTEEQVAALEQAVYKLNAYSKKLEAKYKKLERQ